MSKRSIRQYKFIGEYLIEAGLLTEAQVGVALTDQQSSPMMFGEIVATRGWVNAQTIEYLMRKIIEPERLSFRKAELSRGMARQAPKPPPHPPANTNTGINWVG